MDIEHELERVIEKNKDRQYNTFETRVDLLAQDCLQEIRRLKEIIEFYQETSQWISVEDRLPEIRDDSVLAYFTNGSIETVHIQDCFSDITDGIDDCGNQLYTKWYISIGITHWMPLPNPPKERR